MFVVFVAAALVVIARATIMVAIVDLTVAVTIMFMLRRNDAARGRDQEPGDHAALDETYQCCHGFAPYGVDACGNAVA